MIPLLQGFIIRVRDFWHIKNRMQVEKYYYILNEHTVTPPFK